MGIIYCLTNSINSKKYVGQTVRTLAERLEDHSKESKRPKYKLHFAIQKYGIKNFQIEVLECCSNEELNDREEYWVQKLNSFKKGYNSTSGGRHYQISDFSKKKISQKLKGRKFSNETIQKMRLAKIGKKMSLEFIAKQKSKVISDETRRKISEANKRRVYKPHTEETKEKMRVAALARSERKVLASNR